MTMQTQRNAPTDYRPHRALRYGYFWAALSLGPLLIAQGRRVRRSVEKLPEPAGQRSGVDGQGPLLRLLIAGDSSAAGVGVSEQARALSGRLVADLAADFRVDWRLEARTGFTTAGLIERLGRLHPATFDAAVIAIGVNDVTHGTRIQDWIDGQDRLLQVLTSRFQARYVLLSSIPPMARFPALPRPLRWYLGSRVQHFNHELQRYLRGRERCTLVTPDLGGVVDGMASDGFHPGAPIYAEWARQLARTIRSRWA